MIFSFGSCLMESSIPQRRGFCYKRRLSDAGFRLHIKENMQICEYFMTYSKKHYPKGIESYIIQTACLKLRRK